MFFNLIEIVFEFSNVINWTRKVLQSLHLLLHFIVVTFSINSIDRSRQLLDLLNSFDNLRAVMLGVLTQIIYRTTNLFDLVNVLHNFRIMMISGDVKNWSFQVLQFFNIL